MKSVKPRNNEDLMDKTIRRLLFSNPSISIDLCRKITGVLKKKTEEEKELIRANLQESLALYREKMKESGGMLHQQDICNKTKDHIRQWESVYGKASLADILSLIDSTNIKLEDLGAGYLTPKTISDMLNEFVIGQDAYSKKLALAVYTHLLRTKEDAIDMPKINLLVYGPSGVGKTYGIQVLSQKLGIPFIIVNCHSIVPEGIAGEKFTDKLTQLYLEKEEKLDNAIIFFDEFDKFFEKNGSYDDRLLEELLLFLDDNNTISYPESYRNDCNYLQISSRRITCILGGLFKSLKEAAQKRLSLNSMGFASNVYGQIPDNQIYEYVNKEDLKKVLNSDELYGRIGHFVRVNTLSEEQLADILLQARESPLDYYRNYFSHHNIHLTITEDGAEEIAHAAYKQHVGVRGMKSILWQILEDEMQDIEGMRIIRINRKYVQKRLKE